MVLTAKAMTDVPFTMLVEMSQAGTHQNGVDVTMCLCGGGLPETTYELKYVTKKSFFVLDINFDRDVNSRVSNSIFRRLS